MLGFERLTQFAWKHGLVAALALSPQAALATDCSAPAMQDAVSRDAAMTVRGELLVRIAVPADADALAARVGGKVVRRSQYTDAVIIALPEASLAAGLRALVASPGVKAAYAHPRTQGASLPGSTPTGGVNPNPAGSKRTRVSMQWQHAVEQTPGAWAASRSHGSRVTVAILDTGVDATPSLPTSAILPGANFVSPGVPQDDDHGHGTHMATIIAGRGTIRGVAPLAYILPVKVLDQSRAGTELALVDGLYYAASIKGVRVINLSLAYPAGTSPSPLLIEALAEVAARGIAIVAASGNDGASTVSYPAALQGVIAVGAAELVRLPSGAVSVQPSTYGNRSSRLDVLAMGGSLTQDINADGIPDGIAGEQVHNGVASIYLAEGTSPAAASVAGLAALLLERGVRVADVRPLLQQTALDLQVDGNREHLGFDAWSGSGVVQGGRALAGISRFVPAPLYDAVIAPYLVRSNPQDESMVSVSAGLHVLDAAGAPVPGATVWMELSGNVSEEIRVVTDDDGYAHVHGAQAMYEDQAFASVTVNAVRAPKTASVVRPLSAAFVERSSFALLASLGEGLGASSIAIDVTTGAATQPAAAGAAVAPSLIVRPFGTSQPGAAKVHVFSDSSFQLNRLGTKSLVFVSDGVGFERSPIRFPAAIFHEAISPAWGESVVRVRSGTQPSGASFASVSVDGKDVFPSYLANVGAPSVILTARGGYASTAVVFADGLLSSTVAADAIAATGQALYDHGLATVRLADASVTDVGFDWAALADAYAEGELPATDALIATYLDAEIDDGLPDSIDAAAPIAFSSGVSMPWPPQ